MKKILTKFAAIVICILITTTVSADLIGYWNFDNANAIDLSDNGNDGVLVGPGVYSSDQPAGWSGKSLDLTPGGTYVAIPNESDYDGAMSAAFWLKINAFSGEWNGILTKGDNAWRIHRSGTSDYVNFTITSDESEVNNNSIDSTTVMTGNVWHHVAATFDGVTMRLYIDGVLEASRAYTGNPVTSDEAVYIGNNSTQGDRYLPGLIDEVRIYDNTLSQNDIILLMTDGEIGRDPVNPADGAEDVAVDTDVMLEWVGSHDPNIVNYTIYLSEVADDLNDPNISKLADTTDTTYPFSTLSDKTYYWRVDAVRNDGLAYTGRVWSFSTELTLPQISLQPKNTVALVDTDAVFTVIATNPLPGDLSYQWYQSFDGSSTLMDGEVTNELTIAVAEDSDQKMYFCEISNEAPLSPVYTNIVKLSVGKLIGHWPLDGDPNDISGFDNHGTIFGDPVFVEEDVPGVLMPVTKVLEFDGDGDIIQIANEPFFRETYNTLEALTVSCWVKDDGSESWRAFVSKNGEDGGWQLRRYDGNNAIGWTTRDTDPEDLDNYYNSDMTGLKPYQDGAWHLVTATYDGSTKVIYLDGLVDTILTDQIGPIRYNEDPLAIGGRYRPQADGYTKSRLSDVRLYNYAITADDALQLYLEAVGNAILLLSEPANQVIDAGQTATFEVVTGGVPVSSYQWYQYVDGEYDIALEDIEGAISGANGPVLEILNADDSVDQNQYYCFMEAVDFGLQKKTRVARLIIKHLLGHWLLNGNGNDSSGYDKHAQEIRTVDYTYDVPGNATGMSLMARGQNESLLIVDDNTDHFVPTYNALTVSAWVKNRGTWGWHAYVSKGGEGAEGWQLRQNGADQYPDWTLRNNGGNDMRAPDGAENVTKDAQWHLLTGTFDGLTTRLYIDGTERVSREVSGPIGPSPSRVTIGGRDNDWGSGARAYIHDVRVYNYALDPADILAMYTTVMIDCENPPAGDTNHDCAVDLLDFANVSRSWLECSLPDSQLCP